MNERLSKTRHISDAALASLIIILLAGLFCIPAFSRQPASAETLGAIDIQVKSNNPSITLNNRSYSLDASSYAIYSDYACTQQVGEILSDANGRGRSAQLPVGRYYLRQLAAPRGYVLSDALLQADIEIDRDARVEHEITPDYAMGDLLLFESNAETGTNARVAAAEFANATFTLSYYDSTDGNAALSGATRTWVFKTDAAGEVHLNQDYLQSGSPFFTNSENEAVLPLGRYVFTLNELPLGYTLQSQQLAYDVKSDSSNSETPSARYEPIEAKMQVIRGDFAFRKIDENHNPMAYIPFLLSYSNGESPDLVESHVLVTDANGDFSSDAARTAHTNACNANDAAVTLNPDGSYSVDTMGLDASSGIWFSLDRAKMSSAPNNMRGALPYGTYELKELPCEANIGMNLVTTQFTVYKDGFTTTLDNIVNTTPAISSLVRDNLDKDKLLRPQANSSITNTLTFQNLVPGSPYTLLLTVICKDTGEQIADEQGAPLTSELEFTPSERNGSLEMTIEFDASPYAGCELMVIDELRSSSGMVISSARENEANQCIEVEPLITANAFDSLDSDKYIMGGEARITERIDYTGLKAGASYTVHAALMDKATGSAARDKQGNPIASTKKLIPDQAEGSDSLELQVDASSFEGRDLVVFNQVDIDDGRTIANLRDIEDKTQTVKTVKLTTSASDEADGDKIFRSNSNDVCIVDTVKYANLEPGAQYKLKGVLMNKETGTVLLVDNKEVCSSANFVPDEISGSVDVKFNFDGTKQTSDVLVAFETLTCNDKVIAEHVDIDDAAQTVTSEEVDPDIAGQDAGGTLNAAGMSSSGTMPKTGDLFSVYLAIALIVIATISLCTAYALHRRSTIVKALRCDESGNSVDD